MIRIALTLVLALGVLAAPAMAASPPSTTVDFEELWEAFPVGEPTVPDAPEVPAPEGEAPSEPAPAEPSEPAADSEPTEASPPQSAAPPAPEDEGSGGGSSFRLVEYGLIALGLLLIAAALIRRRGYLARESRVAPQPQLPPPAELEPEPVVSSAQPTEYTPGVFLEFAEGLSENVLERAIVLFEFLHNDGVIDAQQLSTSLDCEAAELSGMLLTPLRRRAQSLGLPLPYEVDLNKTSRRRVWRDNDGLATEMFAAMREVHQRRTGGASAKDSQAAAATSRPGKAAG